MLEPVEDLRRAVVTGASWSVGIRWSMRLLGLVSTAVLARLLVPADFGLVAMAMIVVGFFEAWLALGLDVALIQNQNAIRQHYDTAWTLRIVQSAVVAIGIAAIAPLAAAYFEEPRLAPVLWVLCPGLVLAGASNIGVVAFRKDLEFHKEYRLRVGARLLGFLVTIGTALWLRSYWALVVGIMSSYGISFAMSYVMHPYRPRLSLARARELWSFSQWMLVGSVGHFVETKADEVLVAGLGSTRQLGLYSVAAEFGSMPGSEIAAPLNQALIPGFSKIQHQPDRLAAAYLNVLGPVITVAFPAGLGLALVAEEVVLVLLGNQWLDAIPLLTLLAIFGGIRASNSLAGSLMLGMGRASTAAIFSWLHSALFLALAIPAVGSYGAEGAAAAKLGGSALLTIGIFLVITHVTEIRTRGILACLWRPLAASALMAVAVASVPDTGAGALVDLILKVAVGAMTYVGALLIVWRLAGCPDGAERFLLGQFRRKLVH